jgi:hypothetical protein
VVAPQEPIEPVLTLRLLVVDAEEPLVEIDVVGRIVEPVTGAVAVLVAWNELGATRRWRGLRWWRDRHVARGELHAPLAGLTGGAGARLAGSDRTGLHRTGLHRAGLCRTGLTRLGGLGSARLDRARLRGSRRARAGLSRAGLSRAGLSRAGLSRTGLSRTGLSRTGLSRTGLSRTGGGLAERRSAPDEGKTETECSETTPHDRTSRPNIFEAICSAS